MFLTRFLVLGNRSFFRRLVVIIFAFSYFLNVAVAQTVLQLTTDVGAEPQAKLEISLQRAIDLAIRNNRDIKSAYLDRLSDKFELHVAKGLFVPDLSISSQAQAARVGEPLLRSDEELLDVSVEASTLLPTGGRVSLTYGTSTSRSSVPTISSSPESFTQTNVNLSFIQPLLRGGGVGIARASLTQAEINERGRVLGLKGVLIDTVTDTLIAYRQYLLEQNQLIITERSLKRSRELVATTEALIKSGRLADLDLIQAEATLAQRELDLESVRNATDAARLNLINILDIDLDTQITLVDQLNVDAVIEPTLEQAYDAVLNQQPAYLQALLGLESAKVDLRLARNNRLWDLDAEISVDLDDDREGTFNGALTNVFSDRGDVRVGLRLTIPFGDRTRKQGVANARITQRQQELQLNELLDSIRISLKDQLRTLKSFRNQVALALRAEELTRRQLELEKIKLNLGRTTNFQVTEFEDELIASQLNTASITTSFLNAAATLEQFMGVTLDTWQIPLQAQRYGYDDIQSQASFESVFEEN